jgi:hypothetical protein
VTDSPFASNPDPAQPAMTDSQYPLEGPWTFPNGRTVFYDRREGRYYDRSIDMYLTDHEAWLLWNGRPASTFNA